MENDDPTLNDPALDDLESPFEEVPIRERVYHVLLTLREPTPVSTVSDRASCSVDAARNYLAFFADLGPATRQAGRPERFERNEEYFDWKYVTHLADTQSTEELQRTIADLKTRRDDLQTQYNVSSPFELDAVSFGDHPQRDPESVWEDLATWVNIDDEIQLHRRARQRLLERGEATA